MLLTASELSSERSLPWWFCLRAQAKREHIAVAYLRQYHEVKAFCPRVRFRRPTSRGPVWFVEAMFPGYLFARFHYATFNGRVRQGRGICGFVQFGDRFGLLPDELIDQLRDRVGENEVVEISQPFVPGQNVQISQGPFLGLEALVTRPIDARGRVEILIEWMGRSLRAEVKAGDLLPLAVRPERI